MTSEQVQAWFATMKDRGWSQAAIAREMGLTAETMVNWKQRGAPLWARLAFSALEKKKAPAAKRGE